MKLRLAQSLVPAERDDLKTELSDVVSAMNDVSTELREISHGLHPAIISRGGLPAAVKMLARRFCGAGQPRRRDRAAVA